MRRTSLLHHGAFIVSILFAGLVPIHTAAAGTHVSRQQALFARAARLSGVPLAILIGLAWEQSRLADHAGPSIDGGYGLLDLSARRDHNTLAAAAHLLRVAPARLRHDDALNVLGGALLLAREARSVRHGSLPASLGDWGNAITVFTGMHSSFAARLLISEFYRGLRLGIHASGVVLKPLPGIHASLSLLSGLRPLSNRSTEMSGPSEYPQATWEPADYNNYRDARRPAGHPIRYVVIHDTEGSCASAVNTFQDPSAQTSAHYLVCQDGIVIQLVHERDIAYHAGNWPINQESIGIEHEGYRDHDYYTRAQYLASAALVQYLTRKYGIAPNRNFIFGHENVPAANHTDPGPNWNWAYYMSQIRGGSLGYGAGVTSIAMVQDIANVYSCPEQTCARVGSANWGEQFAVRSQKPGWVEVEYAGKAAWLHDDSIVTGSGYLVPLQANASVYAGPDAHDAVVGTVNAGQTYVSLSLDHHFWFIYFNHRYGFVPAAAVHPLDCRPANAAFPACTGTSGASLVVLPGEVHAGISTAIAGTGLTPNSTVTVTLDGQSLMATTSTASGSFAGLVTIPADTVPGPVPLSATDSDGQAVQSTMLIESAYVYHPGLTVSSQSAVPGARITIRGRGFPGDQLVRLQSIFTLVDGQRHSTQVDTLSGPHGVLQTVHFTIPLTADSGAVTLVADSGQVKTTVRLTVQGVEPTATLTPTSTPTITPTATSTSIPTPAISPTPAPVSVRVHSLH
ncbi:MAG: N-acetylmuramoyl-L-alanine amidase [Chloroflexota bacterium]